MKKFKNILCLMFVLLIGCIAFVGCGPEKENDNPPENPPIITEMAKDEFIQFINETDFTISHWQGVYEVMEGISDGMPSRIKLQRDDVNGDKYIYESEWASIKKEYCESGVAYNYKNGVANYKGTPLYTFENLTTIMPKEIILQNLTQPHVTFEIAVKTETTDYICFEATCKSTAPKNVLPAEYQNEEGDTIILDEKLTLIFDKEMKLNSLKTFTGYKSLVISNTVMENYTENITAPDWFNIEDFDNIVAE